MKFVYCTAIIIIMLIYLSGIFLPFFRPKHNDMKCVRNPKVLLFLGYASSLFFLLLFLFALKDNSSIFTHIIFIILALLGSSLIVAYINCRIYYNDEGFSYISFWGIKRNLSYEEIEYIQGKTKDRILKAAGHRIFIDAIAVNTAEFIAFANKRYRSHFGRAIPSRSVNGKRDLFDSNLENPGEFIFIFVLLLAFVLGTGLWVCIDSIPDKNEELETRHFSFIGHSYDDALFLFTDNPEEIYRIYYYDKLFEDDYEFVKSRGNGTVYTAECFYNGKADEPYFEIKSLSDATGKFYFDLEEYYSYEFTNYLLIVLLFFVFFLITVAFIFSTVYVARHPGKFKRKTVNLFFKEGYIRDYSRK